jgi:beta-galactosidase
LVVKQKGTEMPYSSKRFLVALTLSASFGCSAARAQSPQPASTTPDLDFPNVLYGAAYYNEYMPGDDAAHAARLTKDVALMKDAGLSVVRMGESTWSLWEPEDGRFDYAWMDRTVDAMGKAGIKVIMGTPTYSIPAWMAHQHPEIFAERIPAGHVWRQAHARALTASARTWTPIRPRTASTPSG